MKPIAVVGALALVVAAHDGLHYSSAQVAYKSFSLVSNIPSVVPSYATSMPSASAASTTKDSCQAEPSQPSYACLTQPELDIKIPECARKCSKSAYMADGCSYADLRCHCSKTGIVGSVLIPCLLNSTCTQPELDVLERLLNPVCTYFNATMDGQLPSPSCSVKTETTMSSSAPSITTVPYQPKQFEGKAASCIQISSSGALLMIAAVAGYFT